MSRIRVVFSIGALHGGGSERQIVSALTHLDRRRFEPHLYLVYRAGPLLPHVPQDVTVAAFEERDRRPMTRIPGGMHRRRVADMRRYLTEMDAQVSFDRTFLMTLVAADAAQQLKIPNVSTIVTDPSTGFAPVAGRFQTFKRRSLGRLYRNSAAVLAVSTGAARSAEHFYGVSDGLVITHYNGVDTESIRRAADARELPDWWQAPARGNRELVRLVCAGRLNHEKGFHLLISAVSELQKRCPGKELRLACLGEGDHRVSLQEQIDRCRLTEQVGLVGFRSDAPAWYSSADVFVLPSLVEGMPNALLEAMACGTPVVASRCPHGPQEILRDNQFGLLCEPNSVDSLQSVLRQVLDDPAEAERRADRGRQRINDDFSQSVAMRRLEETLISVVRGTQ